MALAVWLFIFVSGGVAGFAQVSTRIYPLLDRNASMVGALALVLLSSVSFLLGQLAQSHSAVGYDRAHEPEMRFANQGLTAQQERFCLLLSWGYIATLGGPAAFLTDRSTFGGLLVELGLRDSGSQAWSALFNAVGTVPISIAAVSMVLEIRTGGRTMRWREWLILFSCLIVSSPIVNPRFWVATVGFAFAGAMGLLGRKWRPVVILPVIAGLLVLFPSADYFRRPPEVRGDFGIEASLERIASKDFDQNVQTANSMLFAESEGLSMGRQSTLSILTFWVPRQLWEQKPRDTGVLVGEFIGSQNTNLSSPLWAEVYVDWGWPGAALSMFLLGVLVGVGDRAYSRDFRRGSTSPIAIWLLASGYSFIVLRGPLLQASARLVVLASLLAVARRQIRASSKEHDLARSPASA